MEDAAAAGSEEFRPGGREEGGGGGGGMRGGGGLEVTYRIGFSVDFRGISIKAVHSSHGGKMKLFISQ